MCGDFTTRDEIRDVYQKRAPIYELAVYGCYLLGFPIGRYRRLVIDALDSQRGDTVIEIGCGTGMNFPLLEARVGESGKIIGVDISEAMLERAVARSRAAGWNNVELVRAAATDYVFPDGVDGIIATGVLTYEPDYDRVIENGAKALAPGKRWVVFDYKMPTGLFRQCRSPPRLDIPAIRDFPCVVRADAMGVDPTAPDEPEDSGVLFRLDFYRFG